MTLTDLGRRIAPQVTAAFQTMKEAFSSARAESGSVLSITAPRTFATNWLAGRLGDFNLAHPNLSVRLDVSDQMVDLPRSSFDAAIRGATRPSPGLISHFLMRMPVTPLVSPSFLATHKLKAPKDLLSVPRISPEDDWWDLWFGTLPGGAIERKNGPGIRFESQVLDGLAAIAGHGVAVLSPPMFKPAIQAGLLVQPFRHVALYKNGFWLVYPEHKRTLPKVRALRDWLLKSVKEAAGKDSELLTPLADSS
jgi:LysR family glycine cleavage system transcriptional activator